MQSKYVLTSRLWRRLIKLFNVKDKNTPVVIRRENHFVSRKDISPDALRVLYRLHKAGFAAHLVGGGVRDLLLKKQPKDFDIATDARPEQVRKLFRNSRIIGRRFLLVHVYFPGEIIEVSTFRANLDTLARSSGTTLSHMIAKDNVYGTIEEDAWRRDFTVNALYYNIADFSIIDFTGGVLDLKHRFLRMIGDPVQRYHEDPVRLLRAVRLATKLDFNIHPDTEAPIPKLLELLQHVPPARLFDEILKLFFEGYTLATYKKLRYYGFLDVLFPQTSLALKEAENKVSETLIELAMVATDVRFNSGQSLNPGFLFSVLLWPALQKVFREQKNQQKMLYRLLHRTIEQLLKEQTKQVMIPRRLSAMMRSIWVLQYHLERRRKNRAARLLIHRYFRAAVDFLELRAEAGEVSLELAAWWRRLQHSQSIEQLRQIEELN